MPEPMRSDEEWAEIRADFLTQHLKWAADVRSWILRSKERLRDSIDRAERDGIQHEIDEKRQDLKYIADNAAFNLNWAADVRRSILRLKERLRDSIDRAERFKIERRIAEQCQEFEHIRLRLAVYGVELETPPYWTLKAPGTTSEPAGDLGEKIDGGNAPAAAPKPSVVLAGLDVDVIVRGKNKGRLTPGQYRVVEALVNAFPERLGADTLKSRSGQHYPVEMIDRLRRDGDWAAVLDKPGKAHGGYAIKASSNAPRKNRRARRNT
jgi:hypothetical protein